MHTLRKQKIYHYFIKIMLFSEEVQNLLFLLQNKTIRKSILRYYIDSHLRHIVCSFILSKFSFKQIIIFRLIFKIIYEKNQKDVTDNYEYCFPPDVATDTYQH